jgi:hypothetical protein
MAKLPAFQFYPGDWSSNPNLKRCTFAERGIWLEVMCLDPGGTPVGKWQSDRCANLNLNSNAADQASSIETWTTPGLATPVKQKLSVTFTPQEKGFIYAVINLAKASATVYVDPKLTVS